MKLSKKNIFVIILFFFILQAFFLFRAAVAVPFIDELNFIELYRNALEGNFNLREFWTPHLGHMYFIPKILFWIFIRLNFSFVGLMVINSLLMSLTAFYAAKRIVLEKNWIENNSWKKTFCFIAVASVFIGLQNWENLYWALQVSVGLASFCTVYSAFKLNDHVVTKKIEDLYWSIASASVVALCVGSGAIFLTGVLFLAVIYNRKCFGQVVWWLGVLLALAIVARTVSYLSENSVHAAIDAAWFSGVSEYLLRYIGAGVMPTAVSSSIQVIFGVGILLTYILLFVYSRRLPGVHIVLLFAYSVIVVLLIINSRLKVGINQPDAPRYYAYAVFFVVTLLVYLCDLKAKFAETAFIVLCALVLFGSIRATYIEYGISPYRKINLLEFKSDLCSRGLPAPRSKEDSLVIQRTFCNVEYLQGLSSKEIIARPDLLQGISGVEVEPDKVWVSPSVKFFIYADSIKGMSLKGYAPKMEKYPSNNLTIEVNFNGSLLPVISIMSDGSFARELILNAPTKCQPCEIIVTSSQIDNGYGADKRKLSWILDVIQPVK